MEINSRVIDLLAQLNQGIELITDIDEKIKLATLNLTAGKKAKASTAYEPAYGYLKTGMELLPENKWTEQYNLSFALSQNFSECAYLCGEFKQAEQECQTLLNYAKTKIEKAG